MPTLFACQYCLPIYSIISAYRRGITLQQQRTTFSYDSRYNFDTPCMLALFLQIYASFLFEPFNFRMQTKSVVR